MLLGLTLSLLPLLVENYNEKKKTYEVTAKKRERSNRMSLMIMNSSISVGIRGAIAESVYEVVLDIR